MNEIYQRRINILTNNLHEQLIKVEKTKGKILLLQQKIKTDKQITELSKLNDNNKNSNVGGFPTSNKKTMSIKKDKKQIKK